jgi:hypothetical protein
MARRISDGEQKRLILVLGRLESLFSPRTPVHGIILVLEKIRAFLGGKSVRTH